MELNQTTADGGYIIGFQDQASGGATYVIERSPVDLEHKISGLTPVIDVSAGQVFEIVVWPVTNNLTVDASTAGIFQVRDMTPHLL